MQKAHHDVLDSVPEIRKVGTAWLLTGAFDAHQPSLSGDGSIGLGAIGSVAI